jgi:hypothetical protein
MKAAGSAIGRHEGKVALAGCADGIDQIDRLAQNECAALLAEGIDSERMRSCDVVVAIAEKVHAKDPEKPKEQIVSLIQSQLLGAAQAVGPVKTGILDRLAVGCHDLEMATYIHREMQPVLSSL